MTDTTAEIEFGSAQAARTTRKLGRLPAAALAVVAAALFIALPHLFSDYAVQLVTGAGILAIATLGLNVTFGAAGQMNLAIGASFAVGAYSSALLTTKGDQSAVAACLVGMAIAGAGGLVVAWPTVRLKGLYLAMATLAVSQGVTAVAIHATDLTNGSIGVFAIPRPELFGHVFIDLDSYYYLVLAIGAVVLLLTSALLRSRPGRACVAVREDEVVARSVGISAHRYKTAAFVIGSVIASLAGSLYAHFYGFISPDAFDITLSIQILSMAVVGGLGSSTGAVVGAFVVTLVPQYFVDSLPDDTRNVGLYAELFYALAVFAVLLWAPKGLVGAVRTASLAVSSRLPRVRGPR